MNPSSRHAISLLSTVLSLLLTGDDLQASPPEPRQVIEGQDHFQFTYRVTLPELKERGRLWLPLGKSDEFQKVEVAGLKAPAQWQLVEDTSRRNWVITLEAGPAQSGQEVEVTYQVQRREKKPYADLEAVLDEHLHPERLVPRHKTFDGLAKEVTKGLDEDLAKGRALYKHTLERMRYDKTGTGWGRGDALYACDARTGNCTDFHAYFIALCRAAGLPARFAIGFTIPADADEGPVAGYHCWAEFHAEGRWIPVDISEADKHPELAEYYFGHHPANRFELTRGRDLTINPSPSSGPLNFLVYPVLEVAGQMVATRQEFWFRRLPLAP